MLYKGNMTQLPVKTCYEPKTFQKGYLSQQWQNAICRLADLSSCDLLPIYMYARSIDYERRRKERATKARKKVT